MSLMAALLSNRQALCKSSLRPIYAMPWNGPAKAEFGKFVYALWLIDLVFMVCTFSLSGAAMHYLLVYAHYPSSRAFFSGIPSAE